MARAVAVAIENCLDQRLACVALYGSGVDGSALAGVSDLDVAVFHHGALVRGDFAAIHRALEEVSVDPFAYLQVHYDDVAAQPRPSLIAGGYVVVRGALAEGARWELTPAQLHRYSVEIAEKLAGVTLEQAQDWSSAIAERRPRQIRLMLTKLKPALRATLVLLGEPPQPTWSDCYDGLARRLAAHEPALAVALVEILRELPAPPRRQVVVGEGLLELMARLGELQARSSAVSGSGSSTDTASARS